MPPPEQRFYATMVAVAVPFVIVGIMVTHRRLADAGLPRWLIVLFFVPVINLLLFALLGVVPSARRAIEPPLATEYATPHTTAAPDATAPPLDYATPPPGLAAVEAVTPRGSGAVAAVAVFVPAGIAVAVTFLAANVLRNYGFGLFIGVPFVLGMISTLIYAYRQPRTLRQCIMIALASAIVGGTALVLVALEGLGCLVMFTPLALPIAILGALVGVKQLAETSATTASRSTPRG